MPTITSPYPESWTEKQKIQGYVNPSDFWFLKKHYPMQTGLIDKIVATLFFHFINELKRIDAIEPLDISICTDDPGYTVLASILAGVSFSASAGLERCTAGDAPGHPSSRDVSGSSGELREALCALEKLRTDAQGHLDEGGGESRSEEEDGKELSGTGDGTTSSN